MSKIKYDAAGYRNYLKMTGKLHLLVEGNDDVRFFNTLFDELFPKQQNRVDRKVDIDNAEDLIKFGEGIGNREKVEIICNSITGQPFEEKLVGFVDREFRSFNLTSSLQDELVRHHTNGRLIWSRGHSVENYFFDYNLLRPSLRDLGLTHEFERALSLFEKIFDSTIRFACAAGLTGRELDRLSHIRGSLDWSLFEVAEPHININLNRWEQKLINSSDALSAKQIITTFEKWNSLVQDASFSVVRWLCHGHMGFKTVWEVYSRCVSAVSSSGSLADQRTSAQKTLTASEQLRFNYCTSNLCRKIKANDCEYPKEVLTLLGLSPSFV